MKKTILNMMEKILDNLFKMNETDGITDYCGNE